MMFHLSEDKVLPMLRFLSGIAAALLLTTCLLQLSSGSVASLLERMLWVYMTVGACIVLASDFSPSYLFEQYVV